MIKTDGQWEKGKAHILFKKIGQPNKDTCLSRGATSLGERQNELPQEKCSKIIVNRLKTDD